MFQITIDFIKIFFPSILFHFATLHILCLFFERKVSKKTSHLLSFLFALYPTLNYCFGTIFLGGGIIKECSKLIIVNNINMYLEQLAVILFLSIVFTLPWYRIFWVHIIISILLLPLFAMLMNKLLMINDCYNIQVWPLTPQIYLYFLSYSAGLLTISSLLLSLMKKYKKEIQNYNISCWFWAVFYLGYGIMILISPRCYHDTSILSKESFFRYLNENNYFDSILTAILLLFLILYFLYSSTEKKELNNEIEQLKKQMELFINSASVTNQQESEIRKLYHDIGNHLNTLHILLNSGETEEAVSYANTLSAKYEVLSKHRYCDNKVINAVLQEKLILCEKYDIYYQLYIVLPRTLNIPSMDLMSIYSNLLDNSIEACFANKDTENYIHIFTNIIGEYLVIKLINSKSARPDAQKKLSISAWSINKLSHGYGLRIIKELADKYNGFTEFSDLGNEYSSLIMLKLS